ncbi:MAG TPA: hypothetical protein VED43_06275, partial [Mycobacterium sp.]|nr:hypothetical protein [Mycobacterium sp.]
LQPPGTQRVHTRRGRFLNALKDRVKNGAPHPAIGLWTQLTTRRGREVRWHTVNQFLRKVWEFAVANIAKRFNP